MFNINNAIEGHSLGSDKLKVQLISSIQHMQNVHMLFNINTFDLNLLRIFGFCRKPCLTMALSQ